MIKTTTCVFLCCFVLYHVRLQASTFYGLRLVSRFDSGARRDGLRGIAWRFEVLETKGVLYVSNAITLQQHTTSCSVHCPTLGILIRECLIWFVSPVIGPPARQSESGAPLSQDICCRCNHRPFINVPPTKSCEDAAQEGYHV